MPRKSDPAQAPPLLEKTETEEPRRLRETARERFRRLAPKRVNFAINRLKMIGNLAGSKYESTPEEAQKVIAAVIEAAEDVRRRFEHAKEPLKHFSLD